MAPPPTTAQLIGQLSTVGLSFVLALAIGFGGGYWVDRQLGSAPWFSFLGFFLGLAAGVLNVYRIMQLAGRPTGAGGTRGEASTDGRGDHDRPRA